MDAKLAIFTGSDLTLAASHREAAKAILTQAIYMLERLSHAKRGDVVLRLATSALIASGSQIPEKQLAESLQLIKLHAKAHGGYPLLIDGVIASWPEGSDVTYQTESAQRAMANVVLLKQQLRRIEEAEALECSKVRLK